MTYKVIMPLLGESMEEGVLVRWFKKEGEKVERGEPLFEVETDKAVLEVESFFYWLFKKDPSSGERKSKSWGGNSLHDRFFGRAGGGIKDADSGTF